MLKKCFCAAMVLLVWAFVVMPRDCFAAGQVNYEASCDLSVDEPATQKNNFIIGACLLGLLMMLHQAEGNAMPDRLKLQFSPKNLVVNFASNYFTNFIVTLFHELGHGLAKKALTGCDFKIHLGKNRDNKGAPFFDSKYLSIEGLDPIAGFNAAMYGAKKYSPLQKILINLSGGAAGILGYFILRTAMFFISNLCVQNRVSFLQNMKNAFSDAMTLDQIVVSQLLNMLIPMQFGNKLSGDAVAIWRVLGVKDESLKVVAGLQPQIAILAFVALAFKQAGSDVSDERYFTDKVLIGLFNYFLQGYLQFKSV